MEQLGKTKGRRGGWHTQGPRSQVQGCECGGEVRGVQAGEVVAQITSDSSMGQEGFVILFRVT